MWLYVSGFLDVSKNWTLVDSWGKKPGPSARNIVIKDIEFNDAFKLPYMEDPLKYPATHYH